VPSPVVAVAARAASLEAAAMAQQRLRHLRQLWQELTEDALQLQTPQYLARLLR